MSVPGTLAGVREASEAVSAWSARQALPAEVRARVLTALDEVLSNVVHHALGGRPGVIR